MDQFADWLWRRHQHHFFRAAVTVVVLLLTFALLLPLGIVIGAVWHLSLAHTLTWCAVGLACGIATAFLGVFTNVKIRRTINAWIAGDHSQPEVARDALLVTAERMAMRAGLLGAPLMLFIAAPLLAHYAGFSAVGYVAVEGMSMVALSLAALLTANGVELLIRPMMEEVGAEMPMDVLPLRRTWGLRNVFAVSTFVTAAGASVVTGTLAHVFGDRVQDAALAGVFTGLVFGVYGTAVNVVGLITPTFRPARELMKATKRVAAGEFTHFLPVTSGDEFGELTVAFNQMMVGLAQREVLHSAFGSYVDPNLAQRLLGQGESVFAGEAVDVTVFFADVRGFTQFAAEASPDDAVARLNELFSIVVPVIRESGGHANQFVGDGVLAVFGTPEAVDDHASRAVRAAVRIQAEVRRVFGDGLHLGIGINTGTVIAGTIGGGGKLEFTVIGDAVNVASRIEELTKETGDCILLTEHTARGLRESEAIIVDRGTHVLRGRAQPIRVFAIDA